MQKFLVISALIFVAAAVPLRLSLNQSSPSDEESVLWERFKATYNRNFFDAHDESYRMGVFVSNLHKISQHNAEQAEGKHTYTMAMNEFGDMTSEEFFAKFTGFRGPSNEFLHSKNLADLSHVNAADSVDWVEKGAVTAVKNQGQCGSCWAFSSTGAIEGAWFLSKGKLESLSEQELMDCSKSEGNQSCEGGLMDQAFEFVAQKGICAESAYPYKAKDERRCASCSTVATISSYSDIAKNELALAKAVTQQPVAVAIEADQRAFQFYSSGVLTGTCGTQLDHGVLAVGYGELDGTKYWKVKNSWGTSWGLQGYVLIERGKNQQGGQCGILLSASIPVV